MVSNGIGLKKKRLPEGRGTGVGANLFQVSENRDQRSGISKIAKDAYIRKQIGVTGVHRRTPACPMCFGKAVWTWGRC